MSSSCCRFCASPLERTFVDLGMSPLSNSYLTAEQCQTSETFHPLHVYVCEECHLVQLPEWVSPDEIFSDYAYFSSYSTSWLAHAAQYAREATCRYGIDSSSFVVEIASNDGYLLKNFVENEVPVLGIEPASNVAEVAEENGIPTLNEFFGKDLAERLVARDIRASLLVGNNVLAHVPNLNDFVSGLKILLAPSGVITMEFPHLLRLMEENQFDTIYHEHFSYFSLMTVREIFAHHGLRIFDVQELGTHGGSIRIHACHRQNDAYPTADSIEQLENEERAFGLAELATYDRFADQVEATKRSLLEFLIEAKQEGKTVAGYGAPAKGNTLLNYCGVRADFLDYTVDRSPHKQGLRLPGTHIPICGPEEIDASQPDYLLILPWNLKEEIVDQMSHVRDWGCQFVVPIPEVEVVA
ncbi:MAG: class I SAM-dependent methyltransferase [Planctomycetota bacterium]